MKCLSLIHIFVGAALEEEKEVNVTFPEDYQAEELAGKAAVFKCTIHKILSLIHI